MSSSQDHAGGGTSAQIAYENAARELVRLRQDAAARPEEVASAEEALRLAALRLRDARKRAHLAPLFTRVCACGTKLGATTALALDQAWTSHEKRCGARVR